MRGAAGQGAAHVVGTLETSPHDAADHRDVRLADARARGKLKHAARQPFAKRGNSSFSRERVDYLQWVLAADLAVIDAQVQVCMAAAQLEKAMGRSLFE